MIDRHDDVNVLEGMYPLREHDTTFHLKVCRDNDRDQDKSMSFTAWEVQQPAMLGKYCSQQGKSVKMQWLGCWTLNQQLTTKTVSSELWLFALNFVERNDIFTSPGHIARSSHCVKYFLLPNIAPSDQISNIQNDEGSRTKGSRYDREIPFTLCTLCSCTTLLMVTLKRFHKPPPLLVSSSVQSND